MIQKDTNWKSRFLKTLFIIISLWFMNFYQVASAQHNCLKIPVIATYEYKPVLLNDTVYVLKNNHRIKFETLKFYISAVTLVKNNSEVWKEENSFHLIDIEEADSNYLCLEIEDDLAFDAIYFNLGIDSITNVSGALGGDLDPTRGMYWTWQNGYVNFKLEGTSDLCNNPKNEFQFHLGGYVRPNLNVQKVKVMLSGTSQFSIAFNLAQFVNGLDLENLNHIMSPNQAAVELAQQAAKCFSIK